MRKLLSPRKDLGLQLLSLYLLLVVPVLVATIIFDQQAGKRIQDEVKTTDLSLARTIAQETDLSIQNALAAVEQLGNYPEVVNADNEMMEPLFQVVYDTRPDVNLVYRLKRDGVMAFHYPTGPGTTVGTDFSFRDYYKRAQVSTMPLISKGRISPTTNQPVATAVMPLWENNEFIGLVATNLKLESLSETISEILSDHSPSEGLQILILDSSGRVIAHPDHDKLLVSAADILPEIYLPALSGESGTEISDDLLGLEHLYSYAPISNAGWAVIVSRPTVTAFSTQITFHRLTLIAFGVFFIIGLLFWMTLARRVIQPIESLSNISQAIGENLEVSEDDRNFLESMASRPDQIGHLIRSIFRMEKSINSRINEQAILLETSKAVVSSLESQIVLNRILEQVERLLGVQMTAIVALDEQNGIFRARASRGLSRQYTEQMVISPDEPLSVTMRALRNKEPVQVSDIETDSSFASQRPRARAEGYRAVLATPLHTQHAPPSALLVYRPDPHVFSENEIRLLVSFAHHATMAIENAALYSRSDMRLQEQTRRLEALVQSLHDGLILSNLNGLVIYANRRISDLANLSPEEVTGTSVKRVMARILSKAAKSADVNPVVQNALSRNEYQNVEIPIFYRGRALYLRLQVFDVMDTKGISIGQGLILQDVTTDRELDRMKSSLISTVSHELRTPLAAIKGYATTLLADDVEWDRKSQREFLNIISDESDRLTRLVNNLLDLSRIESGNLRLVVSECSIPTLINRAAKRTQIRPSNPFEIYIEENLPILLADEPRLETVLRNLIENSVKYAGDNARISVRVNQQSGKIIFRVEDNGPGFPFEEKERIFDHFYRLDNTLARTASGAGLGLAICQGFVRAHEGEIWVEPRDKGSCIAFSIPLNIQSSKYQMSEMSSD